MKINFIPGKIDLQDLRGADALVCPTDSAFSGTGALEKAIREAAGPDLIPALEREKAQKLAKYHCKQLKSGDILVTEGFRLKDLKILHLAVPSFFQAEQEPECMKIACFRLLSFSQDLGIRRLALALPGVGGAGWSYANSMDALWQAILHHVDPCRGHRSPVEILDLYYPADAHQIISEYRGRASQAFFIQPSRWGTRGDLYLWSSMMCHFDDPKFNFLAPQDFIQEIQRYFHDNTGKWLCGDSTYLSGTPKNFLPGATISGEFARVCIPLLVSSLVQLDYAPPQGPAFLMPVELIWGFHQEEKLTEALKLPYELLPLLTHLRSPRERMNDTVRHSLDFQNLYFVTIHHHKYFPDLIDHYSLDVEDAHDRHYTFSEEAAQALIRHFHEHPKALIRGLKDYLRGHGGPALERLVGAVSSEHHFF